MKTLPWLGKWRRFREGKRVNLVLCGGALGAYYEHFTDEGANCENFEL